MKKGKDMINRIKINKLLFIIPFLFFLAIILQMTNLTLATKIDGIDLKTFANKRNTSKQTLYANRGTIFTNDGAILAQTVDSYTVIAYLSSKRSVGFKTPRHVIDKQATAKSLAPLINMPEESILKLLNKTGLYQVELRPGGLGITELTKEAIEKLQLPGIDFIQTFKRYYPNNDFLSYTLGYVRTTEDYKIIGEMGIEKQFNEKLSGVDGYLSYQKDLNGYKIPNTPEVLKEQKDGMNIYLTINDNIQMFTERAVKDTAATYGPDWMSITVADAKTGAILGTASSPSFNPNIKDIDSYLNPLVSYTYEPGSTMKIFTYMAAMEKGTYNGSDTFLSGKIKIGDDEISDWNGTGWGRITYDAGFLLSSNVGVANMMNNFINKKDLKDYLNKLGFGDKTGFELPNEANGKINFKYAVELANAGFGQGITITPIQYLQAFSAIANDGVMIKPYIVSKIVDPNTNKTIYKGQRQELGTVASSKTVDAIKELMYKTVNGDASNSTGYAYKIDGYNIIGKTGTAQYVDLKTGKYSVSDQDVLKSFSGIFPKDDPQIIIYGVIKRPDFGGTAVLANATKKLIKDISKYLNIYDKADESTNIANYIVPSFINQNTSIIDNLSHIYIKIGNGSKIIEQYPLKGNILSTSEKLFVVTNDSNILLANMTSWSSREVNTYCKLINLKCNIEGYGYVASQSVPTGTSIKDLKEINVVLKRTNAKVSVGG